MSFKNHSRKYHVEDSRQAQEQKIIQNHDCKGLIVF